MNKCPVCGNEYEDVCETCNPGPQGIDPADKADPVASPAGDNNGNAALLTTVGDNFEASLVETRLKANGIPVMLKYRESGAYLSFYMGKSSFGVDIYVPESFLEDAKMLISPPQEDAAEDSADAEEDTGEAADESLETAREDHRKRVESRAWLVGIAIIFVICVVLVVSFASK